MLSIFETNPANHMAFLNAASTWAATLTGSGAQHIQLTVGQTYRFINGGGGDVRLGFGATADAADTDALIGKGEPLADGADPRQFTITSAAVQWVSRTSVAADTDVIIRQVSGQ